MFVITACSLKVSFREFIDEINSISKFQVKH